MVAEKARFRQFFQGKLLYIFYNPIIRTTGKGEKKKRVFSFIVVMKKLAENNGHPLVAVLLLIWITLLPQESLVLFRISRTRHGV